MNTTTQSLEQMMTTYPNVSLRKIAKALELNYNMLLKKRNEPIANTIWDPNAINYVAIEEYIRTKKSDELDALNWEELNTTTIAEKADVSNFVLGTFVTIRGTSTVYEVALLTETHIVLNPCSLASNDTTPRVFNFSTFMHQSPKIQEAPVATTIDLGLKRKSKERAKAKADGELLAAER